jgi:hypothetical protein
MVMRYLGGINSPSYNPLAANVTTGVTTVQQGGIYTSSSASQNIPTGQWVDDPFFNQTTLLLQADNAVNGAQNNTFLDSSSNNFTVTRNANATQGSLSPFSVPAGYWSNSFAGGTTTLLATPSTSLFSFGTNNFSFEIFGFAVSWPAIWRFITTPTPFAVNGDTTSGLVKLDLGAGGVSTGITLPLNTWFHFVVTRQSGTVRVFLDGVLRYTVANSTNFSATGVTSIGGIAGFSQAWSGYLSNLRVVNGNVPTAYQTSSTTLNTLIFTPPTSPLTTTSQGAPGTNTFLTCQSNRFVDNGTSALAITPTGTTAVRPLTAFNNNVPQFNGPTGTGSVFSRGFDNYALITQSLIPRDQRTFTIEAWVYITVNDQQIYPQLICDDAFGDFNWTFGIRNSRRISFMWRTAAGVYQESRGLTSLPFNTWQHIAISVTNDEIWLYLNGVADISSPNSLSNRLQVDNRTVIGGIAGTSNTFFYQGLVSNLSVLNGVGKYPNGTTFTVPTAPLPVDAAGQVLLFARPSATDSNITVAPKTVTITGSMPNNIGSPFANLPVTFPNAGGAAYFDGTGDYLDVTGSSNLAFGPDNWTIELWVYPSTATGDRIIYDSRPTSTNGLYPTIYQSTNTIKYFTNNADRITSAAVLLANSWNHVVVSRVSTTTRMFINGTVQSQTYTDTNSYLNGASRPRIGDNGVAAGAAFSGYVSDVRSLKNVGVTSVTVPTAPLVPIANTQLLLSGTNAGISDATRLNAFETVGNAQVSTAVKKYGSGSMFFDGTGDWLFYPDNPDINFSTGDFTIEGWINFSDTGAQRSIAAKGVANSSGWELYCNASPTLLIFVFGNTITYSAAYNFIVGQWYHVAVVRSGTGIGNIKMFINGFLTFESGVAVNNDLTTIQPLYVGAGRGGGTPFFGYIDDFRLTKGYARYTSTFNPPTMALPRQG